MKTPKLTKLEFQVMEALWSLGNASVREIHETFTGAKRPAYTTIQTTVYRLEAKNALRRVKTIGKANIFAAAVSRAEVQTRSISDVLNFFGGRPRLLMAHLLESGQVT